jgi:hypothetical protein
MIGWITIEGMVAVIAGVVSGRLPLDRSSKINGLDSREAI